MADVVEIARSRRSRLAAEIARLDDFIRMAETLLRYGEGPGRGTGKAGDGEPEPLLADLGAEAGDGSEGGPQAEERTGAARPNGKTPQALNGSAASAVLAGEVSPAGDAEQIDANSKASTDEEELVLQEGRSPGEAAADARLDAEVGQRLRQRRWMMGMTKKQLADRLGIEVEEIQNYEHGKAHIGTGRMWHLAAALEVPMSYFFGEAVDEATEAHVPAAPPRLARTA